jgi:hypothetical protein
MAVVIRRFLFHCLSQSEGVLKIRRLGVLFCGLLFGGNSAGEARIGRGVMIEIKPDGR